jgi:hypothetical protein
MTPSDITMKRYFVTRLTLLIVATSYSNSPALAEDVYFGTFDDVPTYDLAPGPGHSGWKDWTGSVATANTSTTIGVTSGTQSLAWQPALVGYYQGIAVKIQDLPVDLTTRNSFIQGMLANTHIALNVTWDRNEWIQQHNGDIGTSNYSQLYSLEINYGPGGQFVSQGFPDIDTGNNNFKGGWDPVNYTASTHTRIIMWDYTEYKPALQALYDAGDLSGSAGWLELVLTTNAGNYNQPVTYYLDSWRFTTPVVGVQGDYNNNGIVDAADYVLWRNGGPLQNEVDTVGTVNEADYNAWRARFGNTSNPGAGSAVPEPAAWLLALVSLSAIGMRRRAV